MFADAIVTKQGNNLYVSHGDDSQTFVEFRKEAVHSEFKSAQHGIPMYDDIDFICMRFPGDKTKIVDRPVNEQDKQRFPKQWAQYEKTGVTSQTGTPIEEWPPLTKGQAMTLKGLGIFTVQHLAGMSDHGLDSFLGARELREKAKVFLEASSGTNATLSQLMARLEQLEIDNQALRDQVAGLPPREPEARKPGRPKKDA